MADIPPAPRGPGPNILMLLLLALLAAGLIGWAFVRNPPDTPPPSATAQPDMIFGARP